MSQLRIAICGSYGTDNKGDEGQLVAIVDALHSLDLPDLALTVLSAAPLRFGGWPDVTYVTQNPLRDPRGYLDALAQSDLYILGGGTLLDDSVLSRATRRRPVERLGERLRAAARVPFWLSPQIAFHLQRKPTVLYAQGVGQLAAAPNRWLVRHTLNRCRVITVRDPLSRERLRAAGVTRPIEVTADCAFSLRPAPRSDAQAILAKEGVASGRPRVGVTLRPWRGFDAWPVLSAFADRCVTEQGVTIVFVPMHSGRDDAVLAQVHAGMRHRDAAVHLRGDYSPGQVKAILGELELVVGMRMHSLIFAAGMEVPMVGLGYMDKVRSFMDIVGLPGDYLALEELDEPRLSAQFRAAWARREQSRSLIAARLVEIQRRERRNLELVHDLIRESRRG